MNNSSKQQALKDETKSRSEELNLLHLKDYAIRSLLSLFNFLVTVFIEFIDTFIGLQSINEFPFVTILIHIFSGKVYPASSERQTGSRSRKGQITFQTHVL